MDVPGDDPGERSDAGDTGGELVYLWDPAVDDPGPWAARPVEVFEMLEGALRGACLDGDAVITGTVSGLRRGARWVSFELVDQAAGASAPDAKLQVVLFGGALSRLDRLAQSADGSLCDGMTASVTGRLGWQPAWGSLRLVGDEVTVVEGRAADAAQRDALVEVLHSSGLLGAQKALTVPGRPLRVALLSAAASAGSADVNALLEGSGVEWRLATASAPMSGPGAPSAIARAIRSLATSSPDVIVVARGGGARSELAAFDSEEVAYAIARCPAPVWTAIGHATDTTVADLVAHRAFATPSAAAGALIERVGAFEEVRRQRQVLTDHTVAMEAMAARARTARMAAAVAVLVLVVVVAAMLGWL